MDTLREEIRKQSRLARMRRGQDSPELVNVPSMEGVRIALVPLNEGESEQGLLAATELDVPDNFSGVQLRNRVAITSDVWHACRMPNDVNEKVWESSEAMTQDLDPSDIDELAMRLTTLMDHASPSLAALTDADIEALKKVWPQIGWRELVGTQAAAARVFLSTLFPELLAASLSGYISTDSSTQKNEKNESTSGA